MSQDIEKKIMKELSKHKLGLTIEELSKNLKLSRGTVSKYIYALKIQNKIHVRKVGPAKMIYC